MPAPGPSLAAPALGLVLALVAACAGPPPVVEAHVFASREPALAKVAVAPFRAGERLAAGPTAGEAVSLVERFMTEALGERGVEVVPAGELRIALAQKDVGAAAPSAPALARLASESFGATGLLVGQVTRFRERKGQRLGTTEPASVAFRVELLAAPTGRRVWSADFDETQIPLSEGPVRARRYPEGGTRWLTAAELARWGARAAARSLLEGR